jgi:hypothetical protein
VIPATGGPPPPWHIRVTDSASGATIAEADREIGAKPVIVTDDGMEEQVHDESEENDARAHEVDGK